MAMGALGLGIELVGKDKGASALIGSTKKGLHDLTQSIGRARDANGKFLAAGQQGFQRLGQGSQVASQGIAGVGAASDRAARQVGKLAQQLSDSVAVDKLNGMTRDLAGSLWGAAKESGTFEGAMSKLKAVSGGTAAELQQMRDRSLEAGMTMGVAPDMAAGALTSLSTAGFKANDAMKMLAPTMQLTAAAAGRMNAEQSGELLAQSMNVFGLKAADAVKVGDMMGRGADMFAFGVEDLGLGIANMSRGVTAMKTNADEALIAFGMVKGAGLSTQSAGTAVSVAMERLANPETQKALKGIGVSVTDAAGRFRPFLSILSELEPAMGKMTDAGRASFLQDAFGAEGMASVGAILTQFKNGVAAVDGLKGVDALKALRGEMANSTGALERFATIASDNLPGAILKAESAWTTFKVVVGEPVGEIAKDALMSLRGVLQDVTMWFGNLSPATKKTIGTIALVGTAILTVVAAGASLVAGWGVIAPALAVASKVLLPLIAVAGLVAGAFYGLKMAADRNLGGLGDRFRQIGGIVSNWGDRIVAVGDRIGPFVDGIREGFLNGLAGAEPTFTRLSGAIGRFLDVLGLSGPKVEESAASMKSWGSAGERIGNALGTALDYVATGLSIGIEFISGYTSQLDTMTTVVDPLRDSVSELSDGFTDLKAAMGLGGVGESTSLFQGLGMAIGFVSSQLTGGVVGAVKIVAGMLNGLANISGGVISIISGYLTGDWRTAWDGAKQVVFGVVKTITSLIGGLVSAIAGSIDALGRLGGKDLGLKSRFDAFQKEIEAGARGSLVEADSRSAARNAEKSIEASRLREKWAEDERRANPAPISLVPEGQRTGMGALRVAEAAMPSTPRAAPTLTDRMAELDRASLAFEKQQQGSGGGGKQAADAIGAAVATAVSKVKLPVPSVVVQIDGADIPARTSSNGVQLD